MRLLVLVCSTNDPSNSATLAESFVEGARSACKCDIRILRLIDFRLPQFTLKCYESGCFLPEKYHELKENILISDGVLIATPIWNFGVPAHLKNFIDWMGCFCLDPHTRSTGTLGGKPFYYIFTGGAPKAAWKGLMRFTTLFIREAIRYFGGTVTGVHYEDRCMLPGGRFGLVVDSRPQSLKKMRMEGEKFARLAERFSGSGKLPLRSRVFMKAYRAGQRIAAKF